ncbi:MAG: biotin--[acetyl-CoA-carboxylase] ligase [Candidatus Omnitrophica bacterium]|nr:biotin--[acetyl-CoA-carboxylase] ligase [Candidatus Omnitrophota bacterium]
MDIVKAQAVSGAVEGLVIGADKQTAGRGRFNRKWESPSNTGLYFSFVLRPRLSSKEMFVVTFLSSLAVCEVCRELGVNASIKWPNDVLIEGKKVCGILTQAEFKRMDLDFLVVGVGLNVNTLEKDIPAGGCSLLSVTGKEFDREEVLVKLLDRIEFWYERVKVEGVAPVVNSWKGMCVTLNSHVTIADSNKIIEGLAIDIADDGGLLVKQNNNEIIKIL